MTQRQMQVTYARRLRKRCHVKADKEVLEIPSNMKMSGVQRLSRAEQGRITFRFYRPSVL